MRSLWGEKMDKVSSAQRQLFILSLLSENKRGYTLDDIIKSLERVDIVATKRMVSRDIDYISQNFFVYEETGGGKTVYKADKYALADIDFSIGQVISLYFAREVMQSYKDTDIAKEAILILDKILAKLPELSRSALQNIVDSIKVVPSAARDDADEEVLELVRQAAQDKTRIRVVYSSFLRGDTQERLFDPYVLEVRDGCWHAIGMCHLRGAVRDLRISRMQRAALTEEGFEVPHGFYESYQRTRFDKLAGEDVFDIEVRFSGNAAKLVKEYHTAKADRLEERDGALVYYKKAALTDDLTSWLLSFGSGAEVMEPGELKERLHEEARSMVRLYEVEE